MELYSFYHTANSRHKRTFCVLKLLQRFPSSTTFYLPTATFLDHCQLTRQVRTLHYITYIHAMYLHMQSCSWLYYKHIVHNYTYILLLCKMVLFPIESISLELTERASNTCLTVCRK